MTIDTATQANPFAGVPCPPWCSLEPGHRADSVHDDGRKSRGHGGPASQFGSHLDGGAYEFTDAPGLLEYEVQLNARGVNMTTPNGSS